MPLGVGRVAGPVVPPEVERQEPRPLAFQVGAESHLVVVHCEMSNAAAELEQLLARIAIPLVLLDGVIDGLLGQAVLQLEREYRQAVDEQRDVQRPLRLVPAVVQLPGDGEAVPLEAFLCFFVAGRWRAVEEIQMVRAMLDAMAQDVDGAALGDLALQPREELAPGWAIFVQRQRFRGFGLCGAKERGKLNRIDAVFAVVVEPVAAAPTHAAVTGRRFADGGRRGRLAGMPRERGADQAFEAAFGGVGGHGSSIGSFSSLIG